jgi:hypothetical protein
MDAELISDEGFVRVPRRDTLGRWFCGVGCDLKAHGLVDKKGLPLSMAPWTNDQVYGQLKADQADAAFHLHMGVPWAANLDAIRHRVLWNMCFNMGWLSADQRHGLGTFTATLSLIQAGHYPEAAAHMLASKWASQVPLRAHRLAARMATGDYFKAWKPGEAIILAPEPPVPITHAEPLPDAWEDTSVLSRILRVFHLRIA